MTTYVRNTLSTQKMTTESRDDQEVDEHINLRKLRAGHSESGLFSDIFRNIFLVAQRLKHLPAVRETWV